VTGECRPARLDSLRQSEENCYARLRPRARARVIPDFSSRDIAHKLGGTFRHGA